LYRYLEPSGIITGVVVAVKAGFSFIEAEGYPAVFCPGSKYKGLMIRKGDKLNFTIVFSAKGPIAINPSQNL
jgi:hypothetical protein